MPELDPLVQAQLAERRGTAAMVLVWLVAKNRSTGAPETIGFWTGDDHENFTIRGETRLYYGAGAVIDVGAVRSGVGIRKRNHRLRLPPMLAETRQALRGYEPRQARVEVHVCPMDLDSGRPLAEPFRIIKGVLEGAPETLGQEGGASFTELRIATGTRLTEGLPAYKSNAALQAVNPTDRGREYSDLGEEWRVRWGVVT
ncbi:hypothetical protein [Litorisediminicola beolgyonensis]|uniref:Uncharacterized protein n=1 Tax=Litorisediminicola beolgyonensis TaxID=1173614 RepID=A0ABW3ZI81_9RHOB